MLKILFLHRPGLWRKSIWYNLVVMKLFNRTFYKFLFSFMGVVAVTLVLIILVGTVGV